MNVHVESGAVWFTPAGQRAEGPFAIAEVVAELERLRLHSRRTGRAAEAIFVAAKLEIA